MAKYTKKQRKHLKSKSGKKNKTGKRLKRSGKKLIRGGVKYNVGDVIKDKDTNNVKTITSIEREGDNSIYMFDNNENLFVPSKLIDDEKYYEKIEPEPFDEIIDIKEPYIGVLELTSKEFKDILSVRERQIIRDINGKGVKIIGVSIQNNEIQIPENSGIVVDGEIINGSFIKIDKLIKSIKEGKNYLYSLPFGVNKDKKLINSIYGVDAINKMHKDYLKYYIQEGKFYNLTDAGKSITIEDDEDDKVIIKD